MRQYFLIYQVMTKQGILIAFEGIDGTGKSTQIALLADFLAVKGFDVITTREPTDGTYGRKIRSMFASRRQLTPEEELGLFMADRREHVQKLLLPALGAGKVVLTDRYYLSTAAYQGAAGHDPVLIIAENEKFAPLPDLVLLLTLTPAESVHRIENFRGESLNDFEGEAGLTKVAAVFADFDMDYIARIDAAKSPEMVHGEIVRKVEEMLAAKEC
jgi:dTMP kinase